MIGTRSCQFSSGQQVPAERQAVIVSAARTVRPITPTLSYSRIRNPKCAIDCPRCLLFRTKMKRIRHCSDLRARQQPIGRCGSSSAARSLLAHRLWKLLSASKQAPSPRACMRSDQSQKKISPAALHRRTKSHQRCAITVSAKHSAARRLLSPLCWSPSRRCCCCASCCFCDPCLPRPFPLTAALGVSSPPSKPPSSAAWPSRPPSSVPGSPPSMCR